MIKSYKARRIVANTLIYVLLGFLGLIWVSPLAYLVMHSFRGGKAELATTIFPQEWTLDNYAKVFNPPDPNVVNFPQWFMNTFIIAIFSCIISTLAVLMVSYAFSRLRFKARKPLINVGMILGMFPGFMTMIAIYYLLKAIGRDRSLVALVICY